MPTYDSTIQDKLDALQALTGADRRPAELCVIYWPSPTGTKIYSAAMYTELPWWPDLADAIETYFSETIPITLTLIPDSTPFIDLPRSASISDDSINLTFADTDGEFSTLLMTYGEGIKTEVFGYWPSPDLLLSLWRGMLHQPKDMNRDQVKITATSGWRAPNLIVPRRPFATSCPFIFGAYFATQAEIDAAKGCPYNAHLTSLERGSAPLVGVPGFTDCPRRVKADCVERLATETFWPGFETRADPIPNNQTKGPNLLAKAIGNESALSDPIRVIFGERWVKSCYLLTFRNETDTNHPEDGFGAALFAVSEGPNLAMFEPRINGQLVGVEHYQIRLGALGQPPTDWSPDVNSYSGTSHWYGRIQGEFDNATASDYSGSVRALGNNEIRVYSDSLTFVEGYSTNRMWCILEMLAHLRWGYGQDYPRYLIPSAIETATWCDEYVTLTDANGNTFSGVRSTFNAEVNPRAIQQQIKDACTAGRIGIPFEFEGKDVFVPLKAEDTDDPTIPVFTDEGPDRNIIYDGAKSSLSWSCISDETMTNQWTVNFDDAANSGVDTQFIFGDQPQQLRAGRAWGDRTQRVINKSQAGYGINSAQEAARFGNSLLYLGPLDSGGILNPFSIKFTTWYSEAFNVQNYKLIKFIDSKLQSRMALYFTSRGFVPYPGADYTCFRVMKYTRKGDLRVEIEAQQYATLDIVLSDPPSLANEYVYFCEYDGGGTGHPIIGRVPKNDFQAGAIDSFEINQPTAFLDVNFGSMALDDDYVYTCNSFPTYVHRFSKANWGTFDYVQIGTVSPDETNTSGAIGEKAIAVDSNYIYVGFTDPDPHSHTIRLHRLLKSDFSTQNILVVDNPGAGVFSIAQDSANLYVVSLGRFASSTFDKAIKVDKASFTVAGTIDLGNRGISALSQTIDVDGTLAFIASNNIRTINKSAWSTAVANSIGRAPLILMLDEGSNNLWVYTAGSAPNLRVYDRTTFAEVQAVALTASNDVTRLHQDDTYVYALQSESSPPTITRISKTDYSITSLETPYTFLYAMAVDSTGAGVVGSASFGAPRDFTATIVTKTPRGVIVLPGHVAVRFSWAPPLLHPELVTGYELRDAASSIVMAADLVYGFTTSLAPGTYTYKVRTTDGTLFSGYTTVTFTVPEPAVTGTDLFVIDDLTLENVFDDLTFDQVTV